MADGDGREPALRVGEEVRPNASLVRWMVELVRSNVGVYYTASSWGWHVEDKLAELSLPAMRYLVVYDGRDRPVAFSSFMATAEEDASGAQIPVLYCYELQVAAEHRHKGLGRRLMRKLEAIAAQTRSPRARKVMLTCFTANREALAFYATLGYEPDEISPSGGEYEILSKSTQ